MEHVQPFHRPFAWRGVALAAALVLVIALAVGGAFVLVRGLVEARSAAHAGPAHRSGATSTAKVVPLRPRSRVSVLVLNGNGVSGAAGTEASRLLAHGYRRATAADAPNQAYARSIVLFRPGFGPEAGRLKREVHARLATPLDGRLPAADSGYQLVFVLGSR